MKLEEIEQRFKEVTGLKDMDLSKFPIKQDDYEKQSPTTNKEKSKKHGEVFTPIFLVDQMLKECKDLDETKSFLDLCAGYGQFSVRALRMLTNMFPNFDLDEKVYKEVESVVKSIVPANNYKLIINGTGIYKTHGPIGDCGTTGRKLAVDFYGGNCKIGGGSPWTKDGTKADLTLNLYARYRALVYIKQHVNIDEVFCSISCVIGKQAIHLTLTDKFGNELYSNEETISPNKLIKQFNLDQPNFASMCKEGLFSKII